MVLEIWLVFPGELLSLPNAILGSQQNEPNLHKNGKSMRIPISPSLLLAHDCHTIGYVCNLKTETLMDSKPKKITCLVAKQKISYPKLRIYKFKVGHPLKENTSKKITYILALYCLISGNSTNRGSGRTRVLCMINQCYRGCGTRPQEAVEHEFTCDWLKRMVINFHKLLKVSCFCIRNFHVKIYNQNAMSI